MKYRVTNHAGPGGSVKHNFREFPQEAKNSVSEIDRSRSGGNKAYVNGRWFDSMDSAIDYISRHSSVFVEQSERYKGDRRINELSVMQRYELLAFERYYSKSLNESCSRNRLRRQSCRDRTAIDLLMSRKTEPEETILQVGTRDSCPSADQLWTIYKDYVNAHNRRFKHVKILDSVLHTDESTPHIHQRTTFIGTDRYGYSYPSKKGALAADGIGRPDMQSAEGRFNNRKMVYSQICRNLWIEVCREHGLDLETEPEVRADRHGLSLIEYKFHQQQRALEDLQEEVAQEESFVAEIMEAGAEGIAQLKEQSERLKKQDVAIKDKTEQVKALDAAIRQNTASAGRARGEVEKVRRELVGLREQVEKAVVDKQNAGAELEELKRQAGELRSAISSLNEEWEADGGASIYENSMFKSIVFRDCPDYAESVLAEVYDGQEYEMEYPER